MMIPGANLCLGQDHQIEINAQNIVILDGKEKEEIQQTHAEYTEDRNSIG